MNREILTKLPSGADTVFYEIAGGDIKNEGFRRFIYSTKESRDVCNQPEMVGFEFTNTLRLSLINALQNFPDKDKIARFDENSILVFNILRGGLNFKLRDALYNVFGFNRTRSSFISSQRLFENGKWKIVEKGYKKIAIPENANIFMGDIVATGSSLENALNDVCSFLEETGRGINNFFLFTIGAENAERVLERFDRRFRELSDTYQQTYLFYIEGRFGLAQKDSPLKIKIEGTDLLRHPALIAPEFELSQYENISHPMERCTIYDGGSRSFDIREYFEDVISYWRRLLEMAESGETLFDVLKERWPENEYTSLDEFISGKVKIWNGVGRELLETIFNSYKKRWTEEFIEESKKPEALVKVCKERIDKLK
jgi:uracil phosphoribosyltransferase